KSIRRENLRSLAKSIGGISRLAERLEKTQSQISHLIGRHPIKEIGDRIAGQVERAFDKPSGWLDRPYHFDGKAFIPSLPREPITLQDSVGILCPHVPLISWEEARQWDRIAYSYKRDSSTPVIASTVTNLGPFAFALKVHGDHMESPTGISFPEGGII